LARTESRGAHYRSDFPAPADAPLYTVRIQSRGGECSVWTEPVALTRATPAGATRVSSMVEIGD
jgi:succinate dehydrogenase/fumarate reductase flavoprotein subunit